MRVEATDNTQDSKRDMLRDQKSARRGSVHTILMVSGKRIWFCVQVGRLEKLLVVVRASVAAQ